jgi:hypothetical protein
MKIKIKIPAQTVTVDAAEWAAEYGLEIGDVRDDVKEYFRGHPQEIIDGLLNRPFATDFSS